MSRSTSIIQPSFSTNPKTFPTQCVYNTFLLNYCVTCHLTGKATITEIIILWLQDYCNIKSIEENSKGVDFFAISSINEVRFKVDCFKGTATIAFLLAYTIIQISPTSATRAYITANY